MKITRVEPIPDRRASVLPDGGDPTVRLSDKNKRRLMAASSVFTNQGTLGIPSVTAPTTTGG